MTSDGRPDDVHLLVLNPNSSKSITDGLQSTLAPVTPPDTVLHFLTGPTSSPASINDPPTSVQSAWACYAMLTQAGSAERALLDRVDGILVCCFSDHPLVGMLRHIMPAWKPCMHILEASLLAGLASARGRPVGILTTGADMVRDIDAGVAAILGGSAGGNDRYAGCLVTGLGVVQLREPSEQEHVRHVIGTRSAELARADVGALILGCAGMAGMEAIIRQGMASAVGVEQAAATAIIDGAKAGVQLLTGQVRCRSFS